MEQVTTQEMREITDGFIYNHSRGPVIKYGGKYFLLENEKNYTEIKPQESRRWVERTLSEYINFYPNEEDIRHLIEHVIKNEIQQ